MSMREFVSVVFCRRCGSRYTEINEWTENGNAIIHCRTCNNKAELPGFTLGRCEVTKKELNVARNTCAGKWDFEK